MQLNKWAGAAELFIDRKGLLGLADLLPGS